jgi:hypothetical protein
MKKIFSFILAIWLGHALHAQVSVYDCLVYPWVTQADIDAAVEFHRPCIILGNGATYNFTGFSYRKIIAENEVRIMANQEFYAGNYSTGGEMHIKTDPMGGFDVAVINRSNLIGVPRYEKLELGVALPPAVDTKVFNFINATAKGINPFLEWQLKVEATFTGPDGMVKKVDGFFYRDMTRDIPNGTWNYLNNTSYPFRIRFAPPENGAWTCQVKIYESNVLTYTGDVFPFSVMESGNPGYVKVHSNQKNLARGNDQVLFPIGQNIPWPNWTNLEAATETGPVEWQAYLDKISSYADQGGKYLRVLTHPGSMDIEWEKLGNYYDRLDYAWEMDKLIDLAEERDIMVEFNLLMHQQFSTVGDNTYKWDFSNYYPPGTWGEPSHFKPYCYRSQLGLTEPEQLFTDSIPLEYLKQRTRYLVSRYGYSTNIYMFELASEIFHLGEEKQDSVWQDNGGNWHDSTWGYINHYEIDPDTRAAVYNYHTVMSDFIKNKMGHNQHLLAVDYGMGSKSMPYEYPHFGSPNWSDPDYSFNLANIDVISLNYYASDPSKLYISDDNSIMELNGELLNTFGKPVFYSECGPAGAADDCNPSGHKIDLMSIPFTGICGMNLWHDMDGAKGQWPNIVRTMNHMNSTGVKAVLSGDWDGLRERDNATLSANVVEQHQLLTASREKGAGYIKNRTYNVRTDNNGGYACTSVPVTSSDFLSWSVFNDSQTDLHLFELSPNTDYLIHYFSYANGDYMASWCFHTNILGTNPLPHPVLQLFGGYPNISPVLWFIIEQNNCNDHKTVNSKISLTDKEIGQKLKLMNTGTEEHIEVDRNIAVYPNTSQGVFTVEVRGDDDLQISEVKVYDLLGKLIKTEKANASKVNIDISEHATGTYILQISAGDDIITRKVLIRRE